MASWITAGVQVQTCITSPPYWNLRDYGVAGQLGLEKSPAEYLDVMVEVFELVRMLLREDGTLWLNMGDNYATTNSYSGDGGQMAGRKHAPARAASIKCVPKGWKPKDMIGMPWRLALALQEAGWYLRQEIIWHKPNAMPESAKDRCTKAHEHLFFLAKSRRYYSDFKAIAEAVSADTHARSAAGGGGPGGVNPKAIPVKGWATGSGKHTAIAHQQEGVHGKTLPRNRQNDSFSASVSVSDLTMRNKRSVWTIPTQPYSEAHFATFPEALVEPCVLAGSRLGDIVFDPFMGSGTVAQVAQRLGRSWLGCELNPKNEALQAGRTRQSALSFKESPCSEPPC